MSNILIIPDIHGRTFWKECIKCECDEIGTSVKEEQER